MEVTEEYKNKKAYTRNTYKTISSIKNNNNEYENNRRGWKGPNRSQASSNLATNLLQGVNISRAEKKIK